MSKSILIAALAFCSLCGVAVPAFASWAIAIGQEGHAAYAWGTSWNYSSREDARLHALSNCRENGPNCKVITDGRGKCVALAFGRSDNAYGWAQEGRKRRAEESALKECRKYSDGSCKIVDTFCDN